MRLFTTLYFTILVSCVASSQHVEMIQKSAVTDSSYYHICKIDSNEFWIGGEYGILKKIDSLGNISSIDFPNEGLHILKIEKLGNYVFLATSNAVIYRYDIKQKVFIKKEFKSLRDKCFYDLIGLQNGSLVVCGGATALGRGEKRIPRGFIATVDIDLKEIKVVWKNMFRFVWTLFETENQEVLAATFNGLSTKILESIDQQDWKKRNDVRGMIHELASFDGEIWYGGSKNFCINNHGLYGESCKSDGREVLRDTGCLWSLDQIGDKIISVTQLGELLFIDKLTKEVERLEIMKGRTLYDVEKISDSKILIVGKGKTVFIADLEKA